MSPIKVDEYNRNGKFILRIDNDSVSEYEKKLKDQHKRYTNTKHTI
jgi:hypothetical protein